MRLRWFVPKGRHWKRNAGLSHKFLDRKAGSMQFIDRTKISVKAGDIIVKGETDATNPNDIDDGGKITVVGVTDNRNRPRGKHWKIIGK